MAEGAGLGVDPIFSVPVSAPCACRCRQESQEQSLRCISLLWLPEQSTRTEGLTQQKLTVLQAGGRKSEIKASAGLVPSEAGREQPVPSLSPWLADSASSLSAYILSH